jgi:hypothetical protein
LLAASILALLKIEVLHNFKGLCVVPVACCQLTQAA